MNWNLLFSPAVLAMLIPVLGIAWWIIHSVFEHRERMAMIARGMDPDAAKRPGNPGAPQQYRS